MKKEYFVLAVIGLGIFGYVLDRVSGPVLVNFKNPFLFLNIISTYPFTAVSIGAKALAIIIAVPFVLSYVNRQYFAKFIIVFVLAALLELYAIQQLATGLTITPIQWTLSFAFAGAGLLIPLIAYIILGLFTSAKKVSKKLYDAANSEEEMKF